MSFKSKFIDHGDYFERQLFPPFTFAEQEDQPRILIFRPAPMMEDWVVEISTGDPAMGPQYCGEFRSETDAFNAAKGVVDHLLHDLMILLA